MKLGSCLGRRAAASASWFAAAVFGLAGCGQSSGDDDTTYTRDKLMDPATCKECHEDHYNEWAGSMHAYASVDPVFRAMNARGQREAQLGDFCVKCHAPLALQEGKTTDGSNLADVDQKFQGITCYFCHQVTNVHGTFNNPLDLANDTTMRGGYQNPFKNKAHHSEYSSLHDSEDLKSADLCGSCHDISVPAHFSGAPSDVELERTYAEWQGSLFKTGKAPLTCGQCHFDQVAPSAGTPIANYPGVGNRPVRHGHRLPGVDVALTDFPDKDKQLEAVRNVLSTSLKVELCIAPFNGAMVITLENTAVGHNVPSGASQDRRLWAEIHSYDNQPGEAAHETFSRGVLPAGTAITDLLKTEPDLWLFRNVALDKDGNDAHMFWNIADVKAGGTIAVPVTNIPTDPKYHTVGDVQGKTYSGNTGTTHSTMTLHMQPIGREVLEDLVQSGDLDPATRDAMPTHDLLPNAGIPVTVDWTADKATSGTQGYPCVQTARSTR